MKLLVCSGECADVIALRFRPLDCECGATGGQYNPDGDTVTIWGTGRLLGLNSRMVAIVVHGHQLDDVDGARILWPYPEDNGKVTRLTARPTEAVLPS